MKKRLQKAKKSKHTASPKSLIRLHSVVIFFGLVIMIFGGVKLYQRPRVLGVRVYLARGGDNNGSLSGSGDNSSSSGGQNSEGSNSSGGSSGGSGSGEAGGNNGGLSGAGSVSELALPENSQVDCVGPDGQHFTTSFKNCFELNNSWHKSNFSFTPLAIPTSHPEQESNADTPEATQSSDVTVQEPHVASDDARGSIVKNGDVEAQTQLPISVDPITHELTLTTPAGTKTLTVLPNQAVQNLLGSHILSNVENIAETTASGTATTQNISLIMQNNAPVFVINGTVNKKILSILPVSFAKQVVVSAETGQTIQTNETFISRILEALSF